MDTSSTWLISIGIVLVTTYLLYMKWLRSMYPPGPWPLPIIGNLHLLSPNIPVDLCNIARKYGPVYTIWMGVQPNVIICDLELAREACIKRGLEFAGRSMTTKGFKIIFRDNEDLISRSYDEKVDIMRKIGQSVTKPIATGGLSIHKVIKEEVDNMLSIIHSMKGVKTDAKMVVDIPVTNIIMRIILNVRYKDINDPEYLEWVHHNDVMNIALEKAVIINCVPWLWYIVPSFRRLLHDIVPKYDALIERYLKQHEETYQAGNIRDVLDLIIQKKLELEATGLPSQRLTRLNVAELVKDLLGAGTQTTIDTVLWSLLILTGRPDIQQKIHQELDNVMNEKLQKYENEANTEKEAPNVEFGLSDRGSLPYLNAFMHESMRRCTLAPLAAPHKTMKDTYVGSYAIPANTSVTFNIYAYHRECNLWPSPLDVIPERFLDENGNFNRTKAKLIMPFGSGPRSCVGENLARSVIFLCLANVLYHFKLVCPDDEKLPTLDEGLLGLAFSPKNFKIRFEGRH